MGDYIELGPVPCNEECYATGKPDYEKKQNVEMQAFKNQLQRMFPNGWFGIKRFPHDFGSYGEVVAYYTPETESEKIAFHVEANLPNQWDHDARRELGLLQKTYAQQVGMRD